MSSLYKMADLVPLDHHSESDGTSQSIYRLPSPKKWTRSIWIDKSKGLTTEVELTVPVEYVRVALAIDDDGSPIAMVFPFDENNQEDRSWAIGLIGPRSFQGVLNYLGYMPDLPLN